MSQEIPKGYCQCGCGEKTNLARQTWPKYGHVKGEFFKYLQGHAKGKKREAHRNWKGGKKISNGYALVNMPEHPRASSSGYVYEHIVIAEKALGKPLPKKAVVHHGNGKNGSSLVICQDQAYHMLLHRRMRALKVCGHANWLKCTYCKQYDDTKNLFIRSDKEQGCHRSCRNEYEKTRMNKIKGEQKHG